MGDTYEPHGPWAMGKVCRNHMLGQNELVEPALGVFKIADKSV